VGASVAALALAAFAAHAWQALTGAYLSYVSGIWITSRILEQYRFDSQPAHDVWSYVPKSSGPPATAPSALPRH
jgi:hypothetical protein